MWIKGIDKRTRCAYIHVIKHNTSEGAHTMRHTCSDGTQTKLQRTGPVGTMRSVRYTCPNCGTVKTATAIWRDANKVRRTIVATLSR